MHEVSPGQAQASEHFGRVIAGGIQLLPNDSHFQRAGSAGEAETADTMANSATEAGVKEAARNLPMENNTNANATPFTINV